MAQVEALEQPPEAAVQRQLCGEDLQQLDRADEPGDGDREARDADVVVDLAHRARERPAVRVAHEGAVGRVHQAHAGGEDDGQRDDREEGHVVRGDAGGDREQTDLGCGVEAEAEEDAERVHLPAGIDPFPDAPEEEAAHQALVLEGLLEPLLVVGATLHLPEDAEHVEQDDEVEQPDQEQEGAGNGRADVAADVLEAGDLRVDRLGGDREPCREREDDRRVAEREEEADAHRALAVLQELAGRVVDRGDVVRVEGVP